MLADAGATVLAVQETRPIAEPPGLSPVRPRGEAAGRYVVGREQSDSGKTVEQVLHGKEVSPDFEAPGLLSYVHPTSEEAEIFFVSNQGDQPVQAECTFHVAGR